MIPKSAPGQLDTSFGAGNEWGWAGWVLIPDPDPTGIERFLHVTNIAVDAGRQIVGSATRLGATDPYDCVFRLHADGSRDTAFASDGYCEVPDFEVEGEQILMRPAVISAVADGSILTFGNVGPYAYACRIESDGELDESFGDHGGAVFDLAALTGVRGRATKPLDKKPKRASRSMPACRLADGSTLFAAHWNDALHFLKIRRDGSLDPSFGVNGVFRVSGEYRSFEVDSRGRLVVVGQVGGEGLILRFDAQGRPDTAFGTDGQVRIGNPGGSCNCLGVKALFDDRLVLLFYLSGGLVDSATPALLRLTSWGARDPEFNGGELSTVRLAGYSYIPDSLAIDDGRRIVVAGWGYERMEDSAVPILITALVTRFMPNGAIDDTFATDGTAIHDGLGGAAHVGIQDGIRPVIVTGTAFGQNQGAVARLVGSTPSEAGTLSARHRFASRGAGTMAYAPEAMRVKALETENVRLKKLLAEQMLENEVVKDHLKEYEARGRMPWIVNGDFETGRLEPWIRLYPDDPDSVKVVEEDGGWVLQLEPIGRSVWQNFPESTLYDTDVVVRFRARILGVGFSQLKVLVATSADLGFYGQEVVVTESSWADFEVRVFMVGRLGHALYFANVSPGEGGVRQTVRIDDVEVEVVARTRREVG
ncbi:hypothetical protein [Luteibacter yeojuensis]|uniref:Delta-60 repeat protein n=1 Tax=Luteibacter yeojuensis TaxID=345309 RepID=A0A7X5QS32_9GAMM|nr:hypothetical protein [Luteibacter yeojuensis]